MAHKYSLTCMLMISAKEQILDFNKLGWTACFGKEIFAENQLRTTTGKKGSVCFLGITIKSFAANIQQGLNLHGLKWDFLI